MRVVDLNKPANRMDEAAPPAAPAGAPAAPEAAPDELACARAQIDVLEARVAHLEAVLEAARGLMTSNQERLLRKLHEVPRELVALTARLERLGGPAAASWYERAGAGR